MGIQEQLWSVPHTGRGIGISVWEPQTAQCGSHVDMQEGVCME